MSLDQMVLQGWSWGLRRFIEIINTNVLCDNVVVLKMVAVLWRKYVLRLSIPYSILFGIITGKEHATIV